MRVLIKHTSLLTFLVLTLVEWNSAVAATFEDVLKYTPDKQAQYLLTSGQAFEISCMQDIKGCTNLLINIAESNSRPSELAMYFLNSIIVLTSSGHSTAYDELLATENLEARLTKLILDKDINNKVRNAAIISHSSLYPPREEILQFFKTMIVGATDYRGGFVSSSLNALEKYESRYGIPIPDYVLSELPDLVNNRSDSVTNQSIRMLVSNKGSDYLPELFSHLELGKHGSSTNQLLVHYILEFDTTTETIDKLKAIPRAVRWLPLEK